MAEISRPWSGVITGDAGPYTFDQWDDIFRSFQAQDRAIDGVFSEQLDELRYTGAATPVTVERGRALVDGTWYENNVDIAQAIANTAANNRIDRLVLRKSWALQTVRLTVITGVEGAAPVAPAIVQTPGVTWDLPLFQVFIAFPGNGITLYRDERNFIGNYGIQGSRDNLSFHEDEFVYSDSPAPALNEFIGRYRYSQDVEGSVTTGSGTDFIGAVIFSALAAATPQQFLRGQRIDPVLHRLRWIIRANQAASHADGRIRMGWFDIAPTPAVPDPPEGIYFRINGAGNYFSVTRTGAVETATDTGIASGATFRKLEIRCSDVAIHFLIDSTLVATHDTNIPPGQLRIFLGLVVTTATAITAGLQVDHEREIGMRTP